ncbi:hypothetical protein ACIBQ1_42635 [Nonomuraea sp. NPDC050153]|uniref:hypothetical protein n=1 Tax=Nonomuraea sp. NPDC050153 TaxID=3364359 RepID=UPI00378824E6
MIDDVAPDRFHYHHVDLIHSNQHQSRTEATRARCSSNSLVSLSSILYAEAEVLQSQRAENSSFMNDTCVDSHKADPSLTRNVWVSGRPAAML